MRAILLFSKTIQPSREEHSCDLHSVLSLNASKIDLLLLNVTNAVK